MIIFASEQIAASMKKRWIVFTVLLIVALTASLADLELTSGIRITRDHIEYFLLRLRDLDVKDRECQKRLVQTFVNAVFIYDDGRVKITYNYSGQSSTITLNQIASAEKGKGFVCCLPCSTSQEKSEPDSGWKRVRISLFRQEG